MAMIKCSECNAAISSTAAACPHCGAPQKTAEPKPNQPPAQPKSRTTAGLLAFFLGGFGIHHFYLGSNMAGIIQLVATFCTCGFAWFLATVESVVLFSMSKEGFNAKYNERTPANVEFTFTGVSGRVSKKRLFVTVVIFIVGLMFLSAIAQIQQEKVMAEVQKAHEMFSQGNKAEAVRIYERLRKNYYVKDAQMYNNLIDYTASNGNMGKAVEYAMDAEYKDILVLPSTSTGKSALRQAQAEIARRQAQREQERREQEATDKMIESWIKHAKED